jgi:hypothetical protein
MNIFINALEFSALVIVTFTLGSALALVIGFFRGDR